MSIAQFIFRNITNTKNAPNAEKFRFWKPHDFINDYKLHAYPPQLGTDATHEFVVPAKLARIATPRDWNFSHVDAPDAAEPKCPWLSVDDGGEYTAGGGQMFRPFLMSAFACHHAPIVNSVFNIS